MVGVMLIQQVCEIAKRASRWGVTAAFVVSGCGGTQPAGSAGNVAQASPAARTELEKRRDAACEAIAPKLTECAREDAVADLAAGRVTKADFDHNTTPEILRKNTERWIAECTAWRDISSRQVRVLEVCLKEESQCGPLNDCLAHLPPK